MEAAPTVYSVARTLRVVWGVEVPSGKTRVDVVPLGKTIVICRDPSLSVTTLPRATWTPAVPEVSTEVTARSGTTITTVGATANSPQRTGSVRWISRNPVLVNTSVRGPPPFTARS